MKRILLLLLGVCGSPLAAQERAGVVVTGARSSFTLHLPDAAKGHYRGTRFDWAGVISDWKFDGHTVFGPWKAGHDPENADDITGPCEEFGTHSPLGYADAKAGETFVKIGVGELEKPKDEPYGFMNKYRVVNAGTRRHEVRDGGHVFTHDLATKGGYGYRLVKTVRNTDTDKGAGLRLTSSLTNTGTKPITTTVYNHNFFNVDADPVGPNYRVEFPFAVKALEPQGRFAELFRLRDGEMAFSGKLDKDFVYSELGGFVATKPYSLVMAHLPSKLRLSVESDQPMSALRIWGISSTICPEPFIIIRDLAPGKTHIWTTNYTLTSTK